MAFERDRFLFSGLKPALLHENDASDAGLHESQRVLMVYLTDMLIELDAKSPADDEEVIFLLDQLNELVKHFQDSYPKDGEEIFVLSRPIMRLVAKAFATVFQWLLESGNSKFSIRLIDLGSAMCDTLSKSVKKLSLKTNWYSTLKHLATVVLQFVFLRFNGFLNSFKSALLTALYKHLAKCYENYNSSVENSRFRASYFNDLLLLIDTVLTNDTGANVLDDKLLNRLVKLSKNITLKHTSNLAVMSKEGYTFPIFSIVAANNYLVHLLKSDRFTQAVPKASRGARFGAYLTHVMPHVSHYIGSFDTSYKKLRLCAAKNLADLLTFHYIAYGVNVNDAPRCLDMTLDLVLDSFLKHFHNHRVRAGLLECLSLFVLKMNLYHQTNSIATGSPNGNNFASVNFFRIFSAVQAALFCDGHEPAPDGSHLVHRVGPKSDFSEAVALLNQLESFYTLLLREVGCDINELIILSKLLMGDVDAHTERNVQFLDDLSNPYRVISVLKLAQLLIRHLDQYVLSQQGGSFGGSDLVTAASQRLFALCKVANFEIRITAIETLTLLIRVKPELTFGILNDSLGTLMHSLDDAASDDSFVFNENQGLAFLISMILTRAPKDYIDADFILRVFSTTTNYLKRFNSTVVTNNVFSTISNTGYDKQLISWIMLMGLFNFAATGPGNSSFFLMESSQFLNLWKNLLGHTIPSSFVKHDQAGGVANLNEIMKLVEIKNHSLACLLSYVNYLAAVKSASALATHVNGAGATSLLTPELARQMNQILSKSFTFVGNLEAQVGQAAAPGLAAQLKVTKLRMLQVLVKLLPFINVRSEFNSSLLIQVVNTFSDPHVYAYAPRAAQPAKPRSKRQDAPELADQDLYSVRDGLTFGLTSKLNMFKVDELTIKAVGLQPPLDADDFDLDHCASPFATSHAVESTRLRSYLVPVLDFDEYFENDLFRPIQHSLLSDYLMALFQTSDRYGYTDCDRYPPSVDTMSVDVCIELFALTFPSIPLKIQQSILETLRLPLYARPADGSLRGRAAATNTAVAVHSMLTHMAAHNRAAGSRSRLLLPRTIATTLADTLAVMDRHDPFVLALNAESSGLCCALLADAERDAVGQQISVHIGRIVDDTDPHARSFHVQALAKICEFGTVANPAAVVRVVFSLMADPHPLVHQWAMDALVAILGSQTQFESGAGLAARVLSQLVAVYVQDAYGLSSRVTIFSNLSFDPRTCAGNTLARMVRAVVNALGPAVVTLDERARADLRSLLYGLMYLEPNDYDVVVRELIKTLEELHVFDRTLVPVQQYARLLRFAIVNNFRTGVSSCTLAQLPLDEPAGGVSSTAEFYPVSTSQQNWRLAVNAYHQLLKLQAGGAAAVPADDAQLLWVCLEADPDNASLRSSLADGLDAAVAADGRERFLWFERLVGYFGMPKAALQAPVLAVFRRRINNSGMFFDTASVPAAKREASPDDSQSDDESVKAGDEEALAGDAADADAADDARPRPFQPADPAQQMVESEPASWKFKLRVAELLDRLLQHARSDARLRAFLATRVGELVRIAFVCATSSIVRLRLRGLRLLGAVIDVYAAARDPLDPDASLLDQQQAQMISAIAPAFGRDSDLDLAGEAIVVASKLVTSQVAPLSRMARVVRILTTALEEFALADADSGPRTMHIGEIPVLTAKNRSKAKLAVLDAWARLRISAAADDAELAALIERYLGILVPMWVLAVREFAMLKFGSDFVAGSADAVDLAAYEAHWLDFVEVLSLVLEEDHERFAKLLGPDMGSFAFVLFGQCVESLVRAASRASDHTQGRVLRALNRLLGLHSVVETVFKDSVFVELIDLLNRLVLVLPRDDILSVVQLSTSAFMGYFATAGSRTVEELHNDVDKLFELLRVDMHAITTVLPLADGELDRARELSETELGLVRSCLAALVQMVGRLPEVIRVDLYTCLLFVLRQIYELNNPELVAVALPTLRSVLGGLVAVDRPEAEEAVTNFFHDLAPLVLARDDKNTLLTTLVVVTAARDKLRLSTSQAASAADVFARGLTSQDHVALAVQSAKSLLSQAAGHKDGAIGLVVEQLIPKLVALLVATVDGSAAAPLGDPRLVLEMLVIFTKTLADQADAEAFYAVLVPLLVWFDTASGGAANLQSRKYVHLKLIDLIAFNADAFRKVLADSGPGAAYLESLVKFDASAVAGGDDLETGAASAAAHIELKTFG